MKEPKSSYVFCLALFLVLLASFVVISSWLAIELLKLLASF
jgi:hypothetical protein